MVTLIVCLFIAGYLAIAFEDTLKINKAAPALITGVLGWVVYSFYTTDKAVVAGQLSHSLSGFSGILFFLMGAMTIVEIIDAHDGFQIISKRITTTSKRRLLWIISLITFFLSPVLDNLTTAIVMVSLVLKIVHQREDRLYFSGMVVIAANAGGAWSPIGDVTTTMLWLGGQITALNIMKQLLLPAIINLLVPLLILSARTTGMVTPPADVPPKPIASVLTDRQQWIVFGSGMAILLLVPVFKTITHLPPYMGILIGLGVMWVVTEIIGGDQEESDKYRLSPAYALRKIDTPSILFFLGILLSIAVLEASGILGGAATWLNAHVQSERTVALGMGLLSSVIDNVPLVAASQGMYTLQQYPTDHFFWELIAYCTGTGGSLLIIGSAAGVAAMGMAHIDFFWYLKRISWLALAGYAAGAAVFLAQMAVRS